MSQRTMADFVTLPDEVRERVGAWFRSSEPPKAVAFALKSTVAKCVAWELIRPQGERGRARNPWRKLHTENFWVWYREEDL